ncbi:MAG: response regulator [Chloroflexi bacterium]|nr:response regulator [Chloroflexota bacterium]
MASGHLANYTALVVDDDPDVLQLVSLALQRQGFTLLLASNGRDALAQVAETRPDVAVVDLMLPDMHGYEICRQLRAVQDIPIVILSAVTDVDVKVAGIEQYADDYLTKPFHPRELVARIRKLLQSSAASAAEAGGGRRFRVLVVEPRVVVAEALARALETERDFEVLGTSNTVKGALATLQRSAPDLVLAATSFIDGSGSDLIQALHQAAPDTRVVLMAADYQSSEALDGVAAGAQALLDNQTAFSQVAGALRRVAEGEIILPPAAVIQLVRRTRQPAPAQTTDQLTPREQEILQLLAEGIDGPDLADRLVVSPHTLRTHVKRILEKLDAHSKLEAVVIGLRTGLVNPPAR